MKNKRTKKIIIPPIGVMGNFIGMPNLERWKGNCYCVASKIVREQVINDNCRAVYGHYLGPISSKSYFRDRRGMPFVPHGWIILSNDNIVDPTRWVFEAKSPYIAVIDRMDDVAEEYDEGGNEWRKSNMKPAPQFNKKERVFPVVLKDEECRAYFDDLLRDKREHFKEISLDQMFWISNLSVLTLGIYAKEIYEWIENMGCIAFIPIDNQIKILDKSVG